MNCDCGVSLIDDVVYCPMHEAAPAMFKALKEIIASQEQMQRNNNLDNLETDMFRVTNAIVKAKQVLAQADKKS